MPRRRKDGKKPTRHGAKQQRLRELLPRIGFDFGDKKSRAMLSGVDSAKIKEHIRAFAGALNKTLVDEALAAVFEPAIAAMEEDPDKISEMMPGEFWGAIKQTLPWIGQDISGHTLFSLVVALIIAHEKYDAASPYENFKHQYGKLAEAVHKFGGLLKQHHQGNLLIMSIYFDSSTSLPSDEEDEDDDEDAVEDEDEGEDEDKDKDKGEAKGEDEAKDADVDVDMEGGGMDVEDQEGELAGAVVAMNLD